MGRLGRVVEGGGKVSLPGGGGRGEFAGWAAMRSVAKAVAGMVEAVGVESVARVNSCVFLHVLVVQEYENMQTQDGILSRFVTRRCR